jgi:hypothetical protein
MPERAGIDIHHIQKAPERFSDQKNRRTVMIALAKLGLSLSLIIICIIVGGVLIFAVFGNLAAFLHIFSQGNSSTKFSSSTSFEVSVLNSSGPLQGAYVI